MEHYYGAWTLVPRIDWALRVIHTHAPATETWYVVVAPRHANVSRAKEITQARLRWLTKNATGTKLIVWSQNSPVYAKGHYHDEGPYCDAAVVLVVTQHRS